jgi:hypothetical protein
VHVLFFRPHRRQRLRRPPYSAPLTFTSNETVTIQDVTDTVTLEFGVWFFRGWSYLITSEGEVVVFELELSRRNGLRHELEEREGL